MTNTEAKEIFDLIEKANTIEKLEEIEDDERIAPHKIDEDKYPRIKFFIESKEIDMLIKDGILNESFEFSENISSKFATPLEKLLYAMAWKNGDLAKLKQIIRGIKGKGIDGNAITFHQFGKHLADRGEPIIDQHVIRAHAIGKRGIVDKVEVTRLANRTLTKRDIERYVEPYKKWLVEQIKRFDKEETNAAYYIDRILYATGKALKTPTKTSPH